MSAFRIVPLAAAFVAVATAAAAQTPAAKVEPAPVLEFGAMSPVMDREIFAHVIFNELEGRFGGSNPEFRWEGQGWIGGDYNKLWIKSEGTFSNGALDDGQHQFLYSRAITTYFDLQGDCAAISTHGPPAIGRPSVSRALPPTFSISRPPALSAGKVISPPNSRPPTIFCSPSG